MFSIINHPFWGYPHFWKSPHEKTVGSNFLQLINYFRTPLRWLSWLGAVWFHDVNFAPAPEINPFMSIPKKWNNHVHWFPTIGVGISLTIFVGGVPKDFLVSTDQLCRVKVAAGAIQLVAPNSPATTKKPHIGFVWIMILLPISIFRRVFRIPMFTPLNSNLGGIRILHL